MTRIAVLSDLHISPPGPLCSFHAGNELTGLLGRLHAEHAIDTLILAGDIFDFLALPGATSVLQPAEIPAVVAQLFRDLMANAWGPALFDALGTLVRAGTRVIVIPGNHDPELAHPETVRLLRVQCGLAADDGRISAYLGPGAWRTRLGDLEVVIGHGHRGDAWNNIDPAQVLHHATANPPRAVELPLGSRLVVGAMRVFRQKYAFVDALKQETPGVPLLLAYLDPVLAVAQLPGVASLRARAWIGGLQRRLQHGPTLATGALAANTSTTASASASLDANSAAAPPSDIELLSDALFDALEPAERTQGMIAAVDSWLAGHTAGADGTLADHGGGKYILRAALRRLGRDGTAFDPKSTDAIDKLIIKDHLPAGCGRRVVIAGHTHAAREIQLDANRTYLNTGTWSDLIPWPALGSDADARSFIDQLAANAVPAQRRQTWALIDEHGGQLRHEPCKTNRDTLYPEIWKPDGTLRGPAVPVSPRPITTPDDRDHPDGGAP